MYFPKHPLWLAGFRPFFALACLSGASLPLAWVLIFAGVWPAPATAFSPLQWHAHEMFFGFGWAMLGGFLLTSTKNWVQIRGYHGPTLMLLAAAWLLERVGMSFGGDWPAPLFLIANNLFLASISALLLWTLIRHRARDSYRDNLLFVILLPAFLPAKYLLLNGGDFSVGYHMTLALFRLAFLIMLERTLPPFMKGAFQVSLRRQPALDMAIKLLALLLVVEFALPGPLTAAIALTLAGLLAIRLAFWQPQLALRRIDLAVMYLGYLAIVGQLLLAALGHVLPLVWVGSVAVHLFTLGTLGLVTPAMIIRIAKGHTGRPVLFDAADRQALYLMLAALLLRVGVPQLFPGAYLPCLYLAAACWLAAFGSLAWRYIPLLLQPRIDGRKH